MYDNTKYDSVFHYGYEVTAVEAVQHFRLCIVGWGGASPGIPLRVGGLKTSGGESRRWGKTETILIWDIYRRIHIYIF